MQRYHPDRWLWEALKRDEDKQKEINEALTQPEYSHKKIMTKDEYLSLASIAGHSNVVRHLLELKANVNCELPPGASPLALAAEGGAGKFPAGKYKETVKLLLDAKADINQRLGSRTRATPLFQAVFHRQPEIMHLLLAERADPNIGNSDGSTPLYMAVQMGSKEDMVALLDAKANIDQPKDSGITPLHMAAYLNNVELVQALVERGADPALKTEDGNKPFDVTTRPQVKGLLEAAVLRRSLPKESKLAKPVVVATPTATTPAVMTSAVMTSTATTSPVMTSATPAAVTPAAMGPTTSPVSVSRTRVTFYGQSVKDLEREDLLREIGGIAEVSLREEAPKTTAPIAATSSSSCSSSVARHPVSLIGSFGGLAGPPGGLPFDTEVGTPPSGLAFN